MNYNWIAHPLYWNNTQICIKSKIWSKVISKNRSVKSTIKYLRKAQFKKTSVLTSNISRKWRKQKLTCVYGSVHHLYFMCTCTCIQKILQTYSIDLVLRFLNEFWGTWNLWLNLKFSCWNPRELYKVNDSYPANIYLFKVNTNNTKRKSLASFWYLYCNFEHISHLILVCFYCCLWTGKQDWTDRHRMHSVAQNLREALDFLGTYILPCEKENSLDLQIFSSIGEKTKKL